MFKYVSAGKPYISPMDQSAVRAHLSTPQISSSLTFHSRFYWSKSAIILLYTILLLPHLSSSLALSEILSRTDVCGLVRSDCSAVYGVVYGFLSSIALVSFSLLWEALVVMSSDDSSPAVV